jgi:hypothetical protein
MLNMTSQHYSTIVGHVCTKREEWEEGDKREKN